MDKVKQALNLDKNVVVLVIAAVIQTSAVVYYIARIEFRVERNTEIIKEHLKSPAHQWAWEHILKLEVERENKKRTNQ